MKTVLTLTVVVVVLLVLLKYRTASAKGFSPPHYFKEYGLTVKLLDLKEAKKPTKEDVGEYVFTLEFTLDKQRPDVQTFEQVWPLNHPILEGRDGVHNMQRWKDYTIFIDSVEPFKIRVKRDQQLSFASQKEKVKPPNISQVTKESGHNSDQVIENILKRFEALGKEYPAMVHFSSKTANQQKLFIVYNSGVTYSPNPVYDKQMETFQRELKRDPKPSTWVERNKPKEQIKKFAPDGIDIMIRIDDERIAQPQIATSLVAGPYHFTIIDFEGPDNKEFNKLKSVLYSSICEEVVAYNEVNSKSEANSKLQNRNPPKTPPRTNQLGEKLPMPTGRIDKAAALQIAKNELAKEKAHKFVIREDMTEEKNFGWIFYFATQEYIDTGDYKYMVPGGSSVAVERDGKSQFLGSLPSLHNETLTSLQNKWTAIELAEKEIAKRQPDYFKDGGFLKQVEPVKGKNGEWFLMYDLPDVEDRQIEIHVDVSKGTILSYKNQWA